jgi:ectoine hydroxylase-related dioxygenase (phytanoyl-CoA dioxygenase family)
MPSRCGRCARGLTAGECRACGGRAVGARRPRRGPAPSAHPGGPAIDSARVAAHLAEIERDGFTIVEDAIAPEQVDELQADLLRIERERGLVPSRNDFEGERTVRIYNLLAHGPLYAGIPVHPNVLPIVEGVLDPGCLISSLSSIGIGPGETAQPIHADDVLLGLPRPHPALVCNSMWALTDFREENGATRVVRGSHKWDHGPVYRRHYESEPAAMRRGSVLIWHGSLWHGGGANRTRSRRVGIAMNYCAGFIRQQENQQLGIPLEVVRGFSPRLRELVGYGIYHGLIGHIDKRTPAQVLLDDEKPSRIVWDASRA